MNVELKATRLLRRPKDHLLDQHQGWCCHDPAFISGRLQLIKRMLLMVSCFVTILSCDSDQGLNCIQTAGDRQRFEVATAAFDKVVIFERIGATFKQGPIHQVVVTTGENLFNDIEVKVRNGQLQIINNNDCNLLRDYGITQVEITSPNLTEIRTSTGEDLKSDGVLSYPELTLLSEDASVEEDFYHTNGDMYLQLDVQDLNIVANNLSYFYLNGAAQNVDFTFLDGDGRIYASDLEIQNATIFHRGTSDWQLDIKENIAGTINGYGDVILKSRPPMVDIEQTWRGRLIFLNE